MASQAVVRGYQLLYHLPMVQGTFPQSTKDLCSRTHSMLSTVYNKQVPFAGANRIQVS